MAENPKELSLREINRVASRYRQEVILVLDLDETVILADARLANAHSDLYIDDDKVQFSKAFELHMHDEESETAYKARIINPLKIAALINHACQYYGGVAFCTAGAWSAKTTTKILAEALQPHLKHDVFLRLQKSFMSNPQTDKPLFTEDVEAVMHFPKAKRAKAWLKNYKQFKGKSLVLFDNDAHHVNSFNNHELEELSGVICNVLEKTKQDGCCYQKINVALHKAAQCKGNALNFFRVVLPELVSDPPTHSFSPV